MTRFCHRASASHLLLSRFPSEPLPVSIFSLLLLSNLLWSAEQHSPFQPVCACTKMAFLHSALAIILVCVFKCSEKLPFTVLYFEQGLSFGIWLDYVFSLVFW